MDKEAAHNRLLQAIEYLKDNGKARSHEEISDLSGISRSNVTSAINGNARYVTEGNLRRFVRAYSDYINEEWLLTGEGKMEKVDKRRLRPHIPAEIVTVAAGFVGTSIGAVSEDDCDMLPVIPYLPDYDFVITVNGDSMEPVLLNNDKIACAWIEPSEDIKDNKVYVVDSQEGPVVKMIKPQGEDIICHSLNPRYEDYPISKNDVLKIAQVVGLVREL